MSSNLKNLTSLGCCSIKKTGQEIGKSLSKEENQIEGMNESKWEKKLQRVLLVVCLIGSLWKEKASVSQLKEAQQIIATVHNR